MFALNINGKEIAVAEDKKLISLLRDDLRLTSVKDGCSEGACGSCTILADGQAIKACVQPASKFVGKKILTVEGLSSREREVYVHCFAEAGAVQCGFCIPGMIMAAKSLLDKEPEPDRAAVKRAIRGNICRCTGYKKIEEAILSAANFFREDLPIPEPEAAAPLSERFKRVDAAEKVLARACSPTTLCCRK
jgi:aerobic-type carbon monoxide dehydrogenase small subunit (CoxS/CutS family)